MDSGVFEASEAGEDVGAVLDLTRACPTSELAHVEPDLARNYEHCLAHAETFRQVLGEDEDVPQSAYGVATWIRSRCIEHLWGARRPWGAIRNGFALYLPGYAPGDLRKLLCGDGAPLSPISLSKQLRVDAAPDMTAWIEDMVRSWDVSTCRQFLMFASGAETLPDGRHVRIRVDEGVEDSRLPVATTCAHTIVCPRYASREVLQSKFARAVRETGFALA